MQSSFESRLDSVDMDSHGLIKVLKDNLRQYPQDTVLRELVQNADDAEATFFASLYIESSHSKKVNPAIGAAKLVLINDGPVTEEQREKMFRLRAGWQIGNESKIGKFGLGLKSIFHWCDFGWKMQLIQKNGWQAKFVDPVGAPNLPLDRIRSRADDESVLNQVQSLVKKHFGAVKKDLFVLVLALRDEATCTYLRDECNYQSISTIPVTFDKHIESEHITISRLLPCLSNLETVVTIVGDKVRESTIEITTQYPNSISRLKRLDTRTPMTFKSSGFIKSDLNGVTFDSTPFALLATEVENEHLSAIYNSDEWPVEWISDEMGDHQVKEKAVQTGGVVLIGNGTSHVRLLHATYLPLRDVLLETDVDGPYGFDILIHGTFHVDSGRNSILKLSATYDGIKTHWNTALYKHVVSPLIIQAIDLFMPMMATNMSIDDEDRVWDLIRNYNSISSDFFSESGITDRTQLIKRVDMNGHERYVVDQQQLNVFALPNTIRSYSKYFTNYKTALEKSLFTTNPDQCLINSAVSLLRNPLSLFSIQESTELSVLATITRSLSSEKHLEQDPDIDGSIIAKVFHWHWWNGTAPSTDYYHDWIKELCHCHVVRQCHARNVKQIIEDLTVLNPKNTVIFVVSQVNEHNYKEDLRTSATILREQLSNYKTFVGQDNRIAGSALYLELSIEAGHNILRRVLYGRHYYETSQYSIPLRNLRKPGLSFQDVSKVKELVAQGKCATGNDHNNLYNLAKLLDGATEFQIEGLSEQSLVQLGFVFKMDSDTFAEYTDTISEFSRTTHVTSKCLDVLFSLYKVTADRELVDRCALKVATWNNSNKWIAFERDLSAPVITKLLNKLDHMFIGDSDHLEFDSATIELLKNHAFSYPDNNCVRLLNSSNLQMAIDDATDDELSTITFDQPDFDRNYLQTVARVNAETLKKLPIIVSKFGKPVVPALAKNGVFVLETNLRIPIIAKDDIDLLLELGVDYVAPDGLILDDGDCVNDNQLFDILVSQSFTDRVWSESQRNRLEALYVYLASRGNLKVELAAKSLRQHVIPNLLNGQSMFLAGDCPEAITTALLEVFHVQLFGDTADPVINDICSIDPELSHQLIPPLNLKVIEDEIWDEQLMETWAEYWRRNSELLNQSHRRTIYRWIDSNNSAAKSLEFYAPLPIHKTWFGELCSPTTNEFPTAKGNFSWLKHIPQNHDFFLASSILNLDLYSETELFEYVCSEMTNLGEVISQKIPDFSSILNSRDLTSFLAQIPFISVDKSYRTVHEILIPSLEREILDTNIACILSKSTEVPEFVKSLHVYSETRKDLASDIREVCEVIGKNPHTYSLGNHQFSIEQVQAICVSTDKPKHPTIRLIKAILDCESLSLSDRNNYVFEVLGAAKGFSYEAVATLTYDISNAGLEENPNIQQLIIGLITSEFRSKKIDFRVPTADQRWSPARSTLLHNVNVPCDNLLNPRYGHEIQANLASSNISDICEYFEHDVWADFQSLKSATLAMLGVSDLTFKVAQSGLPTGVTANDLTNGFDREQLSIVAFYVRMMNKKTRMQYCDGHFADVETSSDQLKSLVDHIDTTTDQIKVYLVLPTTSVDPNKLRSLLLDLAPTIYRELGMDSDECIRRLQDLRDDGQTTITETQQIALSRFQTTLQMIGESRMPPALRQVAEDLTSQQLRLTKSHVNMLERHQQGLTVQLDVHEIGLIGENRKTQNDVIELLENDSSIHQQSIEAIRDATTRYSYDKLSFAFELIQNADDALEQLKDLDEFPNCDVEVVIDISNGAFILAHPGRRINYYQNQNRSIQISKFKNDLVYMLTLNLTDKSDVEVSSKDHRQYHQVTGKYGLGFKSVYHVTDDVKITSGELAAEFRCGIWPMRLDNESRARLDAWRAIRGIPKTSTVIQLGGVTEVPSDFNDALVLLPLSTRNIRTIKYIDSNGNETTYTCNSKKIAEHVNIIETMSNRMFLQVIGTDQYTWQCFELIDGLPVRIKDISNYWVTVPTRATHKPGFICNASFPLNSARTDVERNPFLFNHFCEMFTSVMRPAYISLFAYLSKPNLDPRLKAVDDAQGRKNGNDVRLAIEDILKGDGPLFSFLNLKGLPSNQQEQAIESQGAFMTDEQKAQANSEQSSDKQAEKPPLRKSEIDDLMGSLELVDATWHRDIDLRLYAGRMTADWDHHVANFDVSSPAACRTWQRLLLRSMFESIGFQNTSSKANLINKPYIERSINLTKSPVNSNYPIELAKFLRSPFWDETDTEEFKSTFYFGELFSTAMLASNLEETVEHIRLSLLNFSINKLFMPREAGFAHLLRGALGPKAIAFLLREVLRCTSRVEGAWLDSYSRPEKYALVIDSNMQKMFELTKSTDHERSDELCNIIRRYGHSPRDIGFDLQINEKLRLLSSTKVKYGNR